MEIVILNGSPRRNGATAKLLKRAGEILENKPDTQVSYFHLADYSQKDCVGCMSCYKKGTCHLKDDLETINRKIAGADALMVGSPVYVSNVPGVLKTFIDRGHFTLEQALKDKYTFAVCTYEIGGNKDVMSILNKLFRISGGIPAGDFQLKLSFNSDPFENPAVEHALMKKINAFYDRIYRRKRKQWFDRLFNYIALRMVIRPYVMKKPEQYPAVLQRWQEIESQRDIKKLVYENQITSSSM